MEALTQPQIKMIMDQILNVRYNDLELAQSLCYELLAWGEASGDRYVTAFAHTYLGDCFVAKCDTVRCAPHLATARSLAMEGDHGYLLARVCNLLGIYYETIADEQSALQYYMEGIEVARNCKDYAAEGHILNNIANHFQRHHGYEQALQFYGKAYRLMQQAGDDCLQTTGVILNNLAAVSIHLGRLEEGGEYIRQCEAQSGGSLLLHILCAQNWCQYYTAKGDAFQAGNYVDYLLSNLEKFSTNRFYAFDVYSATFDNMVRLRNAPAAVRLLALMEKNCAVDSHNQRQQLENCRMTYCLAFETDKEKQDAAYQHYCHSTRKLVEMSDLVIAEGLKATIQLFRVARQREKLLAERSNLKCQVNLDMLTQVYTRRYLEELISQYQTDPALDSLGFIMIDVDCLKEYNDTYGHQAGDEVLRSVGACLAVQSAATLYPCRFGGDEFVCLCAGMTDEEIVTYLSGVRNELETRDIPHRTSRCSQRVTLSIGFSNEPTSSGISARTLLEWADNALYNSKMNGRNTYRKHSL